MIPYEQSYANVTLDADGCVETMVHQLDAKWTNAVNKYRRGWHGMLVAADTFFSPSTKFCIFWHLSIQ